MKKMDGWKLLDELKEKLLGSEYVELKYSLNYTGPKNYQEPDLPISKVLWYKDDEDEEGFNESKDSACPHCGCGYKRWFISCLEDGNYAFIDVWNGCLTYEAHSEVWIAETLDDLLTMCMTPGLHEDYLRDQALGNVTVVEPGCNTKACLP